MNLVFSRALTVALVAFGALSANTATLQAADAPAPVNVVPLRNADFSLPKVPDDQKWLTGAKADGWTYDIKGGVPGVSVEYWKQERPPLLFWNTPNGTISQIAADTTVDKAGTVYQLSYFYGGQGAGTLEQTAAILVDGQPVAMEKHDLEAPKGGAKTASVLTYSAKPEDVGKSVGVSFGFNHSGTEVCAGRAQKRRACGRARKVAPLARWFGARALARFNLSLASRCGDFDV